MTSNNPPARLAVVIPVLNEAELVAASVASALGLSAQGLEVAEVVVSDGGSDDATRMEATKAGARVIDSPRGRGAQLRAAIEQTQADVILMLHADSRLDPAAAEQLATALSDKKTVCGAFRQQIDEQGAGYRLLEWGNALRVRLLGLPYGDQAIFVRRDALDSLGGVPDLPLLEDVALMQRLRWRGWPVLLPGPVVVSARRWRRHGLLRQPLRNWALLMAFTFGVPVKRLVKLYRPN